MMDRDALTILLTVSVFIACVCAGPVNQQSRASSELGSTNETITGCSLGDLVYLPGDAVPGRSICETCSCGEDGAVRCTKAACHSKPGCKALHTPDACCPTYQCECEKDGRVYANGEKLIDPADPCRVCYCQGGEVVCRHIACFKRDDCEPRKVTGRCCPEYDHCPIRGVSTDKSTKMSSTSAKNLNATIEKSSTSDLTNKSLTLTPSTTTGIKIKELSLNNYDSIKIPSPPKEIVPDIKKSAPVIKVGDQLLIIAPAEVDLEMLGISTPSSVITVVGAEGLERGDLDETATMITESKKASAITKYEGLLTTKQGSFISEPINFDTIADQEPTKTVKREETTANLIEIQPNVDDDDNISTPEHNPEFPFLPDDLSGVDNEDEDSVGFDQNHTEKGNIVFLKKTDSVDNIETTSSPKDTDNVGTKNLVDVAADNNLSKPSELSESSQLETEDLKGIQEYTTEYLDTERNHLMFSEKEKQQQTLQTEMTQDSFEMTNENMMEIVDVTEKNVQNYHKLEESMKVDVETVTNDPTIDDETIVLNGLGSDSNIMKEYFTTNLPEIKTSSLEKNNVNIRHNNGSTTVKTEENETQATTQLINNTTEKSLANITVLSNYSQPIKKVSNTTTEPEKKPAFLLPDKSITIKKIEESPSEKIKPKDNLQIDFVLSTAIMKQVTEASVVPIRSTSAVEKASSEVIQLLTQTAKSSSQQLEAETIRPIKFEGKEKGDIIQPPKHKNVLTLLINLVGDVASIDEQGKGVKNVKTNDPHSEEYMPVSNKKIKANKKETATNKSKNPDRKFIEIKEDESDSFAEYSPNDKVEPTTRRPIIDHVSDVSNASYKPNHEIEIINKVYVPTMKRPNKIMKKNSEKPTNEEEKEKSEVDMQANDFQQQNEEVTTENNSSPDESTVQQESSENLSKLVTLESSTILQ